MLIISLNQQKKSFYNMMVKLEYLVIFWKSFQFNQADCDNNLQENCKKFYKEYLDFYQKFCDYNFFELYNGYPGYDFEKIFKNVQRIQLDNVTECTLEELINYEKTRSAYNTFLKQKKNQDQDPLLNLKQLIQSQIKQQQVQLKVNFRYFLIILSN
ncbi:hypothetical protein IMG5_172370 [Ichthyophthirius multifiliis]|uniref:Uncharacterized protein n=1 Tax=Ichthyophthirius multifiliis TaxID=5932 RepID=G0R1R3_ICHMU|nr:hypothetical protein IMG5_172370 [Ichthyophthirius multifiliis]EGR28565.1 hypothetical protein IMG5_172370 [Ichthyophthirius multifiliis]|eukprot:XP_004029801.1 hypothetical protein IMG5_172370 [Ichthyophthirius multifiliis]